MGCESSFLDNEKGKTQNVLPRNSSHILNMNFCDFVKGNTGTVYEEYHFTGWIYRSSSSIVRWAMHKRSKVSRVVKIIARNITTQQKTMREINILKKVDNPSIVKIYQYFIDTEFIYLIFQPIDGKEIYNPIVGVQEFIIRNMQNILKQIFIGLDHLHTKQIVHCNLVPENILIAKVENNIYVKIIGFGNAINLENKKQTVKKDGQNEEDEELKQTLMKKKISNTYRSPEHSMATNIDKQDIWSVGIIMMTILSKIFGSKDFLNFSQDKIKSIIRVKSQNMEQSLKSIDLLRKLLEEDPAKRLSASQCLKHQYFDKVMKTSPWKVTVIFKTLHNFQINQRLKAFLSMYITFKETSIQEQNQFLTQFYNLDKNKDGCLQYEEMLEGLMNYYDLKQQFAKKYINEIFQKLDKNRNMCIQYSEFLLGTVNLARVIERKSIQNLFNEIDKNSDGYIDCEELKEVFGTYKAKAPENLKKISLQQFQTLITTMTNVKNA